MKLGRRMYAPGLLEQRNLQPESFCIQEAYDPRENHNPSFILFTDSELEQFTRAVIDYWEGSSIDETYEEACTNIKKRILGEAEA